MVVNRSAPRATVVPILVYEDVGQARLASGARWRASIHGRGPWGALVDVLPVRRRRSARGMGRDAGERQVKTLPDGLRRFSGAA